jgi:hypothetical protein
LKRIAIIWATIMLGLILHSQIAFAQQIYKWTDEKGTTHYADNVNAVPEKYQDQVQKKDVDELPPVLTYKPKTPQSSSGEPSSNTPERSRPADRVQSESIDSGPSPGYVPFEKFKYITKGMTEAEVLSRLGSPTREEESEVKSKGTITGNISPGGALNASYNGNAHAVKKYYYIGDRSKGEQTRVITFEKGRVVSYQTISP